MTDQSKTNYNEKEKIWYGIKEERTFDPESSLGEIIFECLQKKPKAIAQISHTTGRHLSYGEMLLLSQRIAQHLEALNLEQGDVIGICAVNSDYLACLVFGCLFRGLVISTLDPSFDKEGIKHTFSITKPKILFCDGAIYQKVKEALNECGLYDTNIFTIDDYKEDIPKLSDLLKETYSEKEFKCAKLQSGLNQLAFILCSSGTTGLPKGVSLTHLAFLNQLFGLDQNMGKRGICFSTLYWISGVLFLLLGTVQNFTRIITSKPYAPEDFIEIVKKYQVEIFLGPPSQMGLLVSCPKLQENDLRTLKMVYLGGSVVPYAIVEKLQSYAPEATINVAYGQTEICAIVSAGKAKANGYCGHLIANVEVKIIDDNNKSLGPNEVGEICSRSTCEWPGYYNNPEETANILDEEKWIHSGDLGYFNEQGELYVIDRKKDILKYNNYHFYPTEIEAVILELEDVREVCVFGVPDIIFTNLPAAAIVKKPGSKLTGEEVYDYVKQKMAHFKYLRGGVYFVEELPKTPSGKVLKRKVTELYKDYSQELLD